MILITGGTGTSGRPIVEQFSKLKQPFRVLARNIPNARETLNFPGVQIVQGDFDDPDSLADACEGVERVLLNSSPTPDIVRQQTAVIDAAMRAGVKHVVKFSVINASPDAQRYTFGKVHGQIEQALEQSGVTWTMLRPTFFMQNFLGMSGTIKGGGIYQPTGEGKAAYVDVRDIAAVAVAALSQPRHESKTYTITGPAALSGYGVADIFSRVLGKPVKYHDIPRDVAKDSMIKGGVPEWNAEAVCELCDMQKQGKMARVEDDAIRGIAKKEPVTLEQFLRDCQSEFI